MTDKEKELMFAYYRGEINIVEFTKRMKKIKEESKVYLLTENPFFCNN